MLKLHSETITHKTDVGGVQLNLQDAAAVRRRLQAHPEIGRPKRSGAEHFLGVTVQPMVKLEGYELIIGSSIDPQFGPVLLFGTGRPAGRGLQGPRARPAAAQHHPGAPHDGATKIYTALKGVRGRKPVDLAALEQLLVRFSQLVVEQRWIKELDINPLLASPERLMALDARVVLHDQDIDGRATAQAGHPPLPDPVRRHVDGQGRHAK